MAQNQVSAGFIIYRKARQGIKFLLLYHGGKYWGFPKGKLGENEKYKKAAVREIEEETGLKRRDLRIHPTFRRYDSFTFIHNKKKINKKVTYFLAESKKKTIRISPREHSGYGWFLYRDAIDILIHKNLKSGLQSAYDTIKKGGKRNKATA